MFDQRKAEAWVAALRVPTSAWVRFGLSALCALTVWPLNQSLPVDAVERAFVLASVIGFASIAAWKVLWSWVSGRVGEPSTLPLACLSVISDVLVAVACCGAAFKVAPMLAAAIRTQSPQTLVAALCGAGLVLAMAMIMATGRRDHSLLPSPGTVAAGVVAAPRVLSGDDRWRNCVHEAGHALICAGMHTLPSGFYVIAKRAVFPSEQFAGHVNLGHDGITLKSARMAEFMMTLMLAGKAAEEAVFGEAGIGATSDHEVWVKYARIFLGNFIGGVYFPNPTDEHEVAYNAKRMAALYESQMEMLSRFFASNADLLANLAEMLKEREMLREDDLSDVLSKVSLPEDFPVIFSVLTP
jgi:hypothetical protein